jgi:hypothetical protein
MLRSSMDAPMIRAAVAREQSSNTYDLDKSILHSCNLVVTATFRSHSKWLAESELFKSLKLSDSIRHI